MKVYLANRYSQKDVMKLAAKELKAKGIEVTSTWPDESHEPDAQMSQISEAHLVEYAYRDLLEISQADMVVFFSVDPTTATVRGGRHVEFGYALGLRKPIIVVGPKENIFHYTSEVRHFGTWEEAVYFLQRKRRSREF
jgi:nucleoside 2-deoxyribosyltransferase